MVLYTLWTCLASKSAALVDVSTTTLDVDGNDDEDDDVGSPAVATVVALSRLGWEDAEGALAIMNYALSFLYNNNKTKTKANAGVVNGDSNAQKDSKMWLCFSISFHNFICL